MKIYRAGSRSSVKGPEEKQKNGVRAQLFLILENFVLCPQFSGFWRRWL